MCTPWATRSRSAMGCAPRSPRRPHPPPHPRPGSCPATEDGRVLPPGLGLTTSINFQPVGGGRAAINGDIAMTAEEVQQVIAALRSGGIQIVTIHNHGLNEQPRLFYLHFWAVDDAATLARALRPALDATHPPS